MERKYARRSNINFSINPTEQKPPTVSVDEATSILKVLPSDRPKEDLDALATFFRENNGLASFWRKFGHKDDVNISLKLASGVDYFFLPFKGTQLFSPGDAAAHYFYVLQGKINIVAGFQNRAFATVAQIGKNRGFGNLGMLDESGTRKAGAVTNAINTKLIGIPKSLFLEIFGKDMLQIQSERIAILRGTKLFRNWEISKLKKIAAIVYEKKFMPGSHLALEGHNIDNRSFIYLIIQGEVDMLKELKRPGSGKSEGVNINLATLSNGQMFCGEEIIKGRSYQKICDSCLTDRGQFSTQVWTASFRATIVCRTLVLSRHGFFEMASQHALDALRAANPPIPDTKLLHQMYSESRKWNQYKERLQAEYFMKMSPSKRERIKKLMNETERQITEEQAENREKFDEIETIHLQNENKIYKGELQTYTSKSKSELKRHFKQFKNMARFMALTSHHRHHHDDHIKKISMHDEFVNSHDFPKIDRYLSESYSTIAENFRGNVHIPNAQTYIQNKKNQKGKFVLSYRTTFKNSPLRSDAIKSGNGLANTKGRFKSDKQIIHELYNPKPPARIRSGRKTQQELDEEISIPPRTVQRKSKVSPRKRRGEIFKKATITKQFGHGSQQFCSNRVANRQFVKQEALQKKNSWECHPRRVQTPPVPQGP